MLKIKKTIIAICLLSLFESIHYSQELGEADLKFKIKNIKELISTNRLDSAVGELNKLIIDEPNNITVLNLLGKFYRASLKYDDAIKTYLSVLKVSTDNLEANTGIAISYFYVRKWKLAKKHFLFNVTRNYQLNRTYDFLGKIEIYSNNLDSAERYFKELLSLDSTNIEAKTNLGIIAQENGNITEAEQYFLDAVSIDKDDFLPYLNLGVFYSSIENHEESIKNLSTALELNPNSSAAHKALGVIFLNNENFDVAEKLFYSALELNKSETEAYFYLILLYTATGQYDKAIEKIELFKELGLIHPQINIAISSLYLKTHKYDKAIIFAKKQMEIFPQQLEGYVILMGLYQTLGMKNEYDMISSIVETNFPQKYSAIIQ